MAASARSTRCRPLRVLAALFSACTLLPTPSGSLVADAPASYAKVISQGGTWLPTGSMAC